MCRHALHPPTPVRSPTCPLRDAYVIENGDCVVEGIHRLERYRRMAYDQFNRDESAPAMCEKSAGRLW